MGLKKHFSKNRFSLRQVIGMLTAVIVGATALAYASVTIPHTFTSGTTASSSEVNANFQALANAINNRTSATLANMTGTWHWTGSVSWLNSSPDASLCVSATKGTMTLNANGTISLVQDNSTNLCVSSSAGSATYPNTGGTFPGTWTVLTNGSGTITFTGGNSYHFQASRDLNTFVATDESGSSSKMSITAVRQ